jgi:1,2-diacylglycerol-3-alpha-glucose alpha-1,2-glucosyltransferase
MGKNELKVCLYLEFYHFLRGFLYKNIGSGLLSSYKNQKRILGLLNVNFVEKWDNSCDILQINTPWIWSLYLIKKARAKNKKVIIWSHVTAEDIVGVFRFGFLISPLAKKYLTYAYNQADIIFSPSEYTKTLLIAYGIPDSKIVAMSNGVDTKKFVFDQNKREITRTEYNLDGVVIGTVGLAIPRKGIDTFLFLAKKFSVNSFMWFGKIYNPILVKAVPKILPKNVVFTGYVGDIIGAFNSIDIFVFPSYEENQGMVILEAASLGLPIIVRDIPVYTGWLVHEKNCLKAKNDEEFVVCLKKLIDDVEFRKHLSINAKVLAEKNDLEICGKTTLQIYEKLQLSK